MKKLFLVILSLLVLGLSGCGTLERLTNMNSKDTLGGLLGKSTPSPSTITTAAKATTGETFKVTLYFADKSGQTLVASEKQIAKTLSPARETINELLQGPEDGSGLLAAVPAGTALLDINVKNETAIVDFSKDIEKTMAKVNPELTVYSIVDTLTQFPTIKRVQFRVEGQSVDKIGGVNVMQAISPNMASVKKHPITQKPVFSSGADSLPADSENALVN